MKIVSLTAERLRELLFYDPETGEFVWKVTRGRHARPGSPAGCMNASGYRHVIIDGAEYKAHRLAVLYVTGSWPTQHVDHCDGNGGNNRYANLREASRSQNIANSRLRKDNKVGLKGVSLERSTGRWMANINKDGKRHYLGLFNTPEAAHSAYLQAARELHGAFARSA